MDTGTQSLKIIRDFGSPVCFKGVTLTPELRLNLILSPGIAFWLLFCRLGLASQVAAH